MKRKSLRDYFTLPVLILILVLASYIALRIFTETPYFLIIGDDGARYLTLARNFPEHTLFDKQVYITHPPVYPYVIHFFSLFTDEVLAARLVALVSSIILFFLVYLFVKELTKKRYIGIFCVILLSVSSTYIRVADKIFKEPFAIMLIFAVFYFFLMYLKKGYFRYLILSSIIGVFLGLTTDHTLFVVPSLIMLLIVFGPQTFRWGSLLPIVTCCASFAFWLLVRVLVYSQFAYYPAAIDGTLVETAGWSFREVMSSHFFKEAGDLVLYGYSFDPVRMAGPFLNMFNLEIAPRPKGLPFSEVGQLFSWEYFDLVALYPVLLFLFVVGLCAIAYVFFRRGIRRNGYLAILGMFCIFLAPITLLALFPRYIMTSIIFLFAIIGIGFYTIFQLLNRRTLFTYFVALCALLLVAYTPFYVMANPYVMTRDIVLHEAPKTSAFLKSLPGERIMGQVGYTQEIAHQTDKHVVALPISMEYFDYIERFDPDYIVYGEYYSVPFEDDLPNTHLSEDKIYFDKDFTSYEVVATMHSQPEKYRLIAVIEEYYPDTLRDVHVDHLYVYEVIT